MKLFSPSSLMSPTTAWNAAWRIMLGDPGLEDFMGTWHMAASSAAHVPQAGKVLGCFRERTYMLTMNPHITNWVPIAVPPLGTSNS